ncbi:MAG TPA: PAS domain S-box protein, partial [Candidatus Obscuribacterales bacterium]
RQWPFGQVWLPDDKGTRLYCSPDVFYSQISADEFRNASLSLKVEKGKGLIGRAWEKGGPVWMPGYNDERLFFRQSAAKESKLQSGFAFPIAHGDKVHCVFEFFDNVNRAPDEAFLEGIEKLSKHLSNVFERLHFQSLIARQRQEQQIIFDSVPAMIWYKDRQNKILRANKPAAESVGLTPQQMIGKSTYDLYPHEADRYYLDDWQVIESGQPKFGIIEPFHTSSGAERWLQTDKIPYKDQCGNIQGVIVFSQDITERKLAEERLLRVRNELEQAVQERTKELQEADIYFKLSRELFCIAGFDGYFKRLNPVWVDILGYSMEELLNTPYIERVHPEDREATFAEGEKLFRGGYVQFFENRYICKDGSVKWLLWSATSRPEEGLIYAVAHDVTARRQAEIELADVSSRITDIARHLPGVIYQFLMRADGSYEFPFVSESCRAVLGYEHTEIEQDASVAFSLVHPDDKVAIDTAMAQSIRSLSTFKFEGRVITRSGAVKWIRASSSPEVMSDGSTLWNGLLMDISDLKAAEEKIKQLNEDLAERVSILAAVNQELEILTHKLELAYDEALEASKLKSEFVANISHEVRTPISAVLGMAELLLDTPLSSEQQSFVRIVSESGQSLLTIINDILDFSKMEAGRLELEVIDLSVRSIVEGCADWLASTARRKRLSLLTFCDPTLPQFLKGDPVRLRQVLLNLISNAIKFTQHGEVLIKATKFRETEDRAVVLFQVTDTGIGLSEAARKRLFQPFAQADGSTTRKYGGTGLGLSISKRLVELMGGEIGVHSEENKGSTFWFTVPLLREKVLESEHKLDVSGQKLRVLVADPSQVSRGIITAYLETIGVKPIEAKDEEELRKHLLASRNEGSRFDFTIVDATSDSYDGFHLARQIVKEHGQTAGKVILLSSFDEREQMERATNEGVFACLARPLRRAHLIDAICKPSSFVRPAMREVKEKPPQDAAALQINRRFHRSSLPGLLEHDTFVMLAEDNPILQQLAERQLNKFGLHVVVVNNGKEAVESLERHPFAMIFMDCQMPEMDGYEATMAIREIESHTGKHVPIIAMTASAMPSDRERCLSSGMDDYLSKPVSNFHLHRILETWLPRITADGLHFKDTLGEQESMVSQPNGAPEAKADGVPLDLTELENLYGEEDLIDILKMFLTEASELLETVHLQLETRNDRELSNVAHQLKGLAAVLCAHDLTRWSLELEQASKKASWEPAQAAARQLENEFQSVAAFVKRFLAERETPKTAP